MLQTDRLRLLPADAALLRADAAGPHALGAALGASVPASWPPEHYDAAARAWVQRRLEDPVQVGWLNYYVLAGDGFLAGTAGYKGAPDDSGMVEIGYSLVREYQGRGLATEAAGALVARAFAEGSVRVVIAETLPDLVGSIRVLEKNGFRLVGEGSEPNVIRFEITREDYQAGRRVIPTYLRPFVRLLGHQAWADRRALQALGQEGAPDAARALLAHVLGAEHIWIRRLNGAAAEVAVWPEFSLPQCRALAQAVELEYRTFLWSLDPAGLQRVVRYRNSAGLELSTTVEDILTHVFLHGAYHRGQVAQLLRLGGLPPLPTDYIAFARGTPAARRSP